MADIITAILAGLAAIIGPLTAYFVAKRKAGATEFDSIIAARKELSTEYKAELDAAKVQLEEAKAQIAKLEEAERECTARADRLEKENKSMEARLTRLEALVDPTRNGWYTPHLARLLWQCPIGLAIVGPDGHWWSVNDELVDILGYTKSELEGGMTFQDVTVAGDVDPDVAMVERVKEGKTSSYSQDKTYLRKTKSPRFPYGIANINLFVQAIRDHEGTFQAFLSFIHPVHDQSPEWRSVPIVVEPGPTEESEPGPAAQIPNDIPKPEDVEPEAEEPTED